MTGSIVTTPPTVDLPPGSTSGGTSVLPPYNITYAIPTFPQTWTGVQSFSPNSMQFLGSTRGSTLLNATAIASGNLTLPAESGALATQAYVQSQLHDYEEGSWTPSITFATPGDLSVSYSGQAGFYVKVGRLVTVWFNLQTSAFTWSTASGAFTINGLPFTAADVIGGVGLRGGTVNFQGITKAGYGVAVVFAAPGGAIAQLSMSGSGVARSAVNASDMPSGGGVQMLGVLSYPSST